jgi:hypothetical protein
MRYATILGGITLCLTVAAAPARAGIVDTPLPVLPSTGEQSKLVFAITGVISRSAATLETVFHCTNLDSKPVEIAVEVFDLGGTRVNDASTGVGAAVHQPGVTLTYVTRDTAAYAEDVFLGISVPINQGSARIVATSSKIICTAQVLDEVNNPPASITALHVVSRTKQKGD